MARAATEDQTAIRVRPFRIAVGNCRRCGREWPAHEKTCRACAAVLGETRVIQCARVVPPASTAPVAPMFAVVLAIELSRRHPPDDDRWAGRAWDTVAPRLTSAVRLRAGPAGAIVAAWPLDSKESLVEAAELALQLGEQATRGHDGDELRGAVAIGVIDNLAGSEAVERHAERLALAAAPGQWLACDEVTRRLADRFVFRPAGLVARWPMPAPDRSRALVGPMTPPALPSAVNGEPPVLVLGRARERHRLLAEMAVAAAGRRRVVLVSAPAGGGKSYLLRRVLADAELELAAGVAFPPLGSGALDPLRALLAALGEARVDRTEDRLAASLARAAGRRAQAGPCAVVIDDIHWASPVAVAAIGTAIARSAADAPLAWVVSARTSALAALEPLVALADLSCELPPLELEDRRALLEQRLGPIPRAVRMHVAGPAERGNPLYLEHLAAALAEGCPENALPGTLHEAVLARLDALVKRARALTRWPTQSFQTDRDLEALERELGDWLDRLETSDVADLQTIGTYLARLRAADLELVIARSILRMPVSANRRLAWAVQRLASASTDALLGYLDTIAGEGQQVRAAHEAQVAADRAERVLRLADADRLLAFALRYDHRPELARKRGDLALALGRSHDALLAYRQASGDRNGDPALQARIARAEATIGEVDRAARRLERLTQRGDQSPGDRHAAMLDLARLRGTEPPPPPKAACAATRRRAIRVAAWASAGDAASARQAARTLVLTGAPAARAAQTVETAALCGLAGVAVDRLRPAAEQAATALDNPSARRLLADSDIARARRTFLHWRA